MNTLVDEGKACDIVQGLMIKLNRSLNIIKAINENSADDIIFNVEINENWSLKFED